MTVAVVALDSLHDLLPDWQVHLRTKGRTPATIVIYLTIARTFADYLSERGMPVTAGGVAREHVEHYLADMQDRVRPATVATHYRSLQQLFGWLADDREITRSPMERMTASAVAEQPVPVLLEDELVRLLGHARGRRSRIAATRRSSDLSSTPASAPASSLVCA